ncbi:MAG: tRNA pseudouridine(13) synthase TruD [Chromatiales bacterium]
MTGTDGGCLREQARNYSPDEHPRAFGGAAGKGAIRTMAGDFFVEESLPFELAGEGEHLCLFIEKTGLNTADVVRLLSKAASLHPRNIGFAGMKDRHAVTRQWFSLYLPGKPDPDFSSLPKNLQLLRALRHNRKLRRGVVRANRFRILVRNLVADAGQLEAKLQTVAASGFPNYFGLQRFGRNGGNLESAIPVLERGKTRKASEGIYLSAVRAMLFNEVLAERIRQHNWNRPIPGDVMQIAGSSSLFIADEHDRTLMPRHDQQLVGVTGPLCGTDARIAPRDEADALEKAALAEFAWWIQGLVHCRVEANRRMLRAVVSGFDFSLDGDRLELEFTLESGCFATSLLRELLDVTDVTRG